jgi:hypothetical protein
MRCVACDEPLSALEMSRKSPMTGEDYLLCTECLIAAGLLVHSIENPLAEIEEGQEFIYEEIGE